MRRLFSTPTLWGLHAIGVIGVVICTYGGYWQLQRALDTGDAQNYAYALQWPIFAALGIFMWWKFVRGELDDTGGERAKVIRQAPAGPAQTVMPEIDAEDAEVVAWNRYLADAKAKKARA